MTYTVPYTVELAVNYDNQRGPACILFEAHVRWNLPIPRVGEAIKLGDNLHEFTVRDISYIPDLEDGDLVVITCATRETDISEADVNDMFRESGLLPKEGT